MADIQFANVLKRLKGFIEQNTRSQFETWVARGRYECTEYRRNYPNENTDFARLDIDTLADGDTWICTRWKNSIYAEIDDPAPPPQQLELPEAHADGMPEALLIDLLPEFEAFNYIPRGARYPYALDGISIKLAPPQVNNCCTFVEALVIKAWQNHNVDFRWDRQGHADIMIMGSDLFSPVNVLVNREIALPLDENAAPAAWSVIQGWSADNRRGHTFIIVAHHVESDRVLTLESNNGYGLDGVGYRSLGGLNQHPAKQAPERWWENANAPTWQQVRRAYPRRRLCALKVNNPQWAWQ